MNFSCGAGDCGESFEHPDANIVEFRRRCELVCGDWSLEVRACPLSVKSFQEFVASVEDECTTPECPSSETQGFNATTPAQLLFDYTNFGSLYWSWNEASGKNAVYGRSTGISVHLEANADYQDIEAAGIKALEYLAAMPALKDGIPREQMQDIIKNDVRYLVTIVAEAGTFGAAVLPGGMDPITNVLFTYDDGNVRKAAVCTDAFSYYIYLGTS